ncbi:hypothetical protein [Streptomyces triticiradicis]|nr:hypothetical protein [Streptomyces triticiradicis]
MTMLEYHGSRHDRVDMAALRRLELLIRTSGLLLERARSVSPGTA